MTSILLEGKSLAEESIDMKTKELVIMALFAAIGAALHSIIPPFLGGMKPDMMLIMMFMGILLFRGCKTYSSSGL